MVRPVLKALKNPATGRIPESGDPSNSPAATEQDRRLQVVDLLKWLVEDGQITDTDADRYSLSRRNSGPRSEYGEHHPLVILGDAKWRSLKPPKKLLTVEALTEWLAHHLKLQYFHIDPLKVDLSSITSVVSKAYAERYIILPVKVTEFEVTIATSEPFVKSWIGELEDALKKRVRIVLANPLDIKRYLAEFYNLARSVKSASKSQKQDFSLTQNFEQLVELGRDQQLDANDLAVVHIVDWLWLYAFEQRASDIHLEPRRELGFVRFRIDGVLHQVYQIPASVFAAMVSRIKLLARMEIVEKRRPQDGRIKTLTPAGDEVELRIATMPTAFGEKVVMRIFDPEVLVRDFHDLGFSDDDHNRWQQMIQQPNGIILVTGPTGSGKTTTLYSTLKTLATPEVNVCSIEDPIEMIEPAFNQMQVQSSIGVDFAQGVRTLMRQDPDIIMVGEIRDLATADMAIQAALTGHLVLSTLHTNDAPSAVTRLMEIGVAPYLIGATLLGVMAQRLVRTLCPHCKEPHEAPADDVWEQLTTPWRAPKPHKIAIAPGCLDCRMTGYRGRIGIYEIMTMTPTLRRMLASDIDPGRIRDQAFRDGMKPLRVSGAMKVANGLTSVEEVMKVAPPQ